MENVTVIYRLKPAENAFEVPALDMFRFADILGDKNLALVRRQPQTNESLLQNWTPSECELAKEYRYGLPVPDVSFWGTYLLLSEAAYIALEAILADAGEFLALRVGDKQMYIFVPLLFAAEDLSKTLIHYEEGVICGIKRLIFEPDVITEKAIFKSKIYGCHGLFVTNTVKAIFDEHGFRGVVFDQDLAGIF